VYEPKEDKWDVVVVEESVKPPFFSSCVVVNNVMYSPMMSEMIHWYDSVGRSWRVLKGLEELPKLPKRCSRVKLVDYGGKIAVLWVKKVRSAVGFGKKRIW